MLIALQADDWGAAAVGGFTPSERTLALHRPDEKQLKEEGEVRPGCHFIAMHIVALQEVVVTVCFKSTSLRLVIVCQCTPPLTP